MFNYRCALLMYLTVEKVVIRRTRARVVLLKADDCGVYTKNLKLTLQYLMATMFIYRLYTIYQSVAFLAITTAAPEL